jgi:hypothetical protein
MTVNPFSLCLLVLVVLLGITIAAVIDPALLPSVLALLAGWAVLLRALRLVR